MSSAKYEKVDPIEDGDADLSDSNEEYDYDTTQDRTSEDVRRHDLETLTAEEEAERLLRPESKKKLFQRGDDEKREARRQRRKERGSKRSKRKGEENELMFTMEEGGPRASDESSGHSSEVDFQRLGEVQARQKKKSSRTARFGKFAAIHVVIIGVFLALLYGAYKATGSHTSKSELGRIAQTLSNGTHTFAPTTLLISLDGFRADFLTRGLTPTLNSFIRSGVSPKYMTPAFPSLTFPNHFTLVTGLHPESHGVVGNTFWDPSMQKEFYYTDPNRSMRPEWWNAEPLWNTAELQGVRSAIHMWPGSEAHIGSMDASYVDEFNAEEELDKKVNRIFSWLDLPGPQDKGWNEKTPRPQFIGAYVPNVDADGHKYGPNSTYIRSTIKEVDGMLGSIFRGIDERNLTDIVNIIVVSDHGMATTSNDRLIQLEDLIDTKLIEHIDGWPLYGLRPVNHDPEHLHKLYNDLVEKSKLPKYKHAIDIYLRDENMPARYHFSQNERIAPLWIVPKAGWAIVTHDDFSVAEAKKNGDIYHPRGLHGYDFEHPLMRAIFVARGPAFPHPQGSRVNVFQNTEVYNIVCDSLGIEPKPNNGTLRLPFKPSGQHNFIGEVMEIEIPHDPQDGEDQGEVDFTIFIPPDVPDVDNLSPAEPASPSKPQTPDKPEPPTAPTRPVVHDGADDEPNDINLWWEWMKGKLDAIKWWAAETLGGKKKGGEKNGNKTSSDGKTTNGALKHDPTRRRT